MLARSFRYTSFVHLNLITYLASILIALSLLAYLYTTAQQSAKSIKQDTQKGIVYAADEEVLYLPSATYLNIVSLGYNQLAADLTWLRLVQYFAGHLMNDREFPFFLRLFDILSELDPRFKDAYMWAGACILYGGTLSREEIEQSNQIYQRALKMFPDAYEPAYQLGINYYSELRSEDPEQRARERAIGLSYLARAAELPDTPVEILSLVSTIAQKMGADEVLYYALNRRLKNAKSKDVQLQLRSRLEKLKIRLKDQSKEVGKSLEVSSHNELIQERFLYLKSLDYELWFESLSTMN